MLGTASASDFKRASVLSRSEADGTFTGRPSTVWSQATYHAPTNGGRPRAAAHRGPLTVPAAAELAGVSRATAYRYFPNNESVVLHATMSLADDPLTDADCGPSAAAPTPLFGSDAVVWTSDVAQLTRDQAIELLAWMAEALIAATLAGW